MKNIFETENMEINPVHDEYIKGLIRGHEKEVEKLLSDTKRQLGEGRTANVAFIELVDKICVKIYKKPEQITGTDFYLPPAEEKAFLEKLENLGTKVRVPKVYSCYRDLDGVDHNFLMMEALSAISVDDILQDRAKLPEGFDVYSFEDNLRDFVQKMHEQNIFHRDLHEGNIMINPETLEIYVIDFGAATTFWGEQTSGENGPYRITKDGRNIILTSDESTVKVVIKKLKEKLTKKN